MQNAYNRLYRHTAADYSCFKEMKIKTTKKTTNTIKNLKKGKTYLLRVCAVQDTVQGEWSKTIKVKIRKYRKKEKI